MSVVPGDNSSCGHTIPEAASGGTHRWTWRDKSRATVGKQREPHCNPDTSWCKRCFWINIYSEDFHLQGLPYVWGQNIEVLPPAMLSRLCCPKQVTKRRKRTELPSLPPHPGMGQAWGWPEASRSSSVAPSFPQPRASTGRAEPTAVSRVLSTPGAAAGPFPSLLPEGTTRAASTSCLCPSAKEA